ncbi:ArnT family glycosyltransferase [Pseudonocardia sp. GCM10023141]|uniref:ArnT family glycosyltransferase n=1 Tax=Pseudonocardia sp. GCM10023141 TaxID=3252653 RepID=UPI0036094FE1
MIVQAFHAHNTAEGTTSSVRDENHPATLRGDMLGRAALAVVGVMTVLSVVRAFGPLTYPGDIWRQSDTATIARNFADNGLMLFFPQINWGGAGPGYVETEFPLMPWLSALLYQVFGEQVWLRRLVSLAFMLVATAAFWQLASRLLPARAARWALIAFAVSPAFMRYGTAFMPEATVLAFYLLALVAFQRWLAQDRGRWLVGAAAATSMAALVKPTSLHIGLVMLVWLLISARQRLRRPSLYVAGVAALVAPALWLRHASGLYTEYGNTFGVISGGDNKFGNLRIWLSPEFYLGNLRSEVFFVYGFVGVPLAVLGAWWLWRHRGPVFPLVVAGLLALGVYYFAVGRYSGSDMGIQYHVYSLPYAALLTGLGLQRVWQWLRRAGSVRRPGAVAGVVVALLAAQSVNVFQAAMRDQGGRFQVCATQLREVTAPGDRVVISTTSPSVDAGVANNWQEPVIFFMADRKGWSLAADRHDPAVLAEQQRLGARFFVVNDPRLVPAGGPLAMWLTTHAAQVRSSAVNGCGIWALNTPGRAA